METRQRLVEREEIVQNLREAEEEMYRRWAAGDDTGSVELILRELEWALSTEEVVYV